MDRLSRFRDSIVDLVYACQVLEHCSHLQVPAVLKELGRVFKPSGKRCLSVPDFERLLGTYRDSGRDVESNINTLMGGQEYAYNYHRVIFTRDYLGKLLLQAGFRRVYEWTPDNGDSGHDVNDWSRHPFMVNERSYPAGLNLDAEK